jgi:hypothetical protein
MADNKLPLSSKTESRFNINIFFSITTSSVAGSKYSSNHYQVHGKGLIKRGGDWNSGNMFMKIVKLILNVNRITNFEERGT